MVDDHIRVTWIHVLKEKRVAFDAIKSFVNMSKIQFEKKVKILRSDNAFEFDDKKYKPLLSKLGIIH